MKDIISNWNQLDKFLYRLDKEIEKIKEYFINDEPDIEQMIEAETNHLKTENEFLKQLQYPKEIKKEDRNYRCPNLKCRTKISNILIEEYQLKYCPECGQRIFLNKPI